MKISFRLANIICVLALCIATSCSKSEHRARNGPLTDYASLRSAVVTEVREGKIKPNQSGVAALPEELKTASMDGRVYISNSQGPGLLVAFNITRGRMPTKEFLVYSEEPIVDKVKQVIVGILSLTFESKIDDHWYQMVER